jgi:hypothetical protein
MSSSIVKAHGGSKDLVGSKGEMAHLGMMVSDTMVGKSRQVSEKHLGSLISKTTGTPREMPVMDGVLSSTKQGVKGTDVPEYHKVHRVGKTQTKRMGQVPFAGSKY